MRGRGEAPFVPRGATLILSSVDVRGFCPETLDIAL